VVEEFQFRGAFRMIAPFDLFKQYGDGVFWFASAATLEEAHTLIKAKARSLPGQYIILSKETGNKTVVTVGQDKDA
jgi:hypothetical protein